MTQYYQSLNTCGTLPLCIKLYSFNKGSVLQSVHTCVYICEDLFVCLLRVMMQLKLQMDLKSHQCFPEVMQRFVFNPHILLI